MENGMRNIAKTFFCMSVLTVIFLAACGGGTQPTPTVDVNALYTQIAQTAYAQLTKTALAVPPTEASTNTPEVTATEQPTDTPLVTDTPFVISSPTKSPAAGEACDNSQYISDVTIPDGTQVAAGASFVKTWRVKNLGPCSWTGNYSVGFGWASDSWKEIKTHPPASEKINKAVAPGEEVDVSITIKAPVESGTFSATFRLKNEKGYFFGAWFTVVIKVTGTPVVPTATPKP
jgi:hypothetical protein